MKLIIDVNFNQKAGKTESKQKIHLQKLLKMYFSSHILKL